MQKSVLLKISPLIMLWGVGLEVQVAAAVEPAPGFGTEISTSVRQRAERGRTRGPRRAREIRRLLSDPEVQARLGLTPEQVDRLEDYRYQFRQRQIELRSQIQSLRLELRRLLREDSPDRVAVNDVANQLAEVRTQLFRERINRRLEAREILTPEQRAEIRLLLREEPRRLRSQRRKP